MARERSRMPLTVENLPAKRSFNPGARDARIERPPGPPLFKKKDPDLSGSFGRDPRQSPDFSLCPSFPGLRQKPS